MSGEKTEEPTQKKLDDARKKGQNAKSQDVNAAAGLFALTVCLTAAASMSGQHLVALFTLATGPALTVGDNQQMHALAMAMLREAGLLVLPYLAVSVAMGLVASFAQVGFNLSFEPLTPNFDKVNPGSGIKKLFSVRSIIDFLKMVLKAVALAAVVWVIVMDLLPLLIGASVQSPAGIAAVAWTALLKLLGAAVVVFIVIGPVDFGIQKWLFKRDQKMSKDEVKREFKEMDGDPLIKGQRRQLAHELLNSDPKARVPTASVVVTNPTHYAVALRYDPRETPLPIVVAKGADEQAARIRALAEQHGVPIVGNPPLARALFRVGLDDPIPEALFEAVAAVLRWVALIEEIGRSGGSLLAPRPESP
ncbi:type III secretion system export apparatus subunit SctU [Aquabacterium sp. A7-Y]|uniref:type III secretion system export apparatus subunit SctU n=1 Tax=Aquabacterium sp. A7-Y TaxID=1349605 RepID=UPI00223CC1E0|nr:type III secretion system export apparatus subunit SctU [Aquabacterium sp. A7-Y]MCW7540804.1 type III secretion system export apparatus subunit SctU [Aquabacterium sp. A7-Y]